MIKTLSIWCVLPDSGNLIFHVYPDAVDYAILESGMPIRRISREKFEAILEGICFKTPEAISDTKECGGCGKEVPPSLSYVIHGSDEYYIAKAAI